MGKCCCVRRGCSTAVGGLRAGCMPAISTSVGKGGNFSVKGNGVNPIEEQPSASMAVWCGSFCINL